MHDHSEKRERTLTEVQPLQETKRTGKGSGYLTVELVLDVTLKV